jgi:hypothetical protein
MTTVQLAIHDSEYAQSLRNLLLRDGTHRVLVVEKPDLKEQGVVVIESNRFEDLSMLGAQPDRFVVITRKGEDHLTRIWEAGVRHVVFEEDSPNTAQLAVIAAELRIPKALTGADGGKGPMAQLSVMPLRTDHHNRSSRAGFAVFDSPRGRSCCSRWDRMTII